MLRLPMVAWGSPAYWMKDCYIVMERMPSRASYSTGVCAERGSDRKGLALVAFKIAFKVASNVAPKLY